MIYPRNIWDSRADWLVIPSNTQGIAGAGLARQAADRYEKQERDYMTACKRGVHEVGYPVITPINDHQSLYWMATKTVVHQPSRLSYIITGFEKLAHQMIANPTTTVALPPVGCGLGGLAVKNVRDLYEKHLYPYFADRIELVGDWGPIDPAIYFGLRQDIATAIASQILYDEYGQKMKDAIDPYDAAVDVLDEIGAKYRIEKR